MNKTIRNICLTGVSLFFASLSANATTVKIDQAGVTLLNSAGSAVTTYTTYAAKWGFFAAGFTPTIGNLTNWEENFVSYNGGWSRSTGRFNFGATLGDSASSTNPLTPGVTGFIGGGTQTGVTGFGAAWSAGKQLAVLVSNIQQNSSHNTTATTNKDYMLPLASTEFALVTDPGWIIPASGISSLDTGSITFAFGASTVATFGTLNFNTGTNLGTLQMIPEPSSAALLMLGGVGLVALRRLRKV